MAKHDKYHYPTIKRSRPRKTGEIVPVNEGAEEEWMWAEEEEPESRNLGAQKETERRTRLSSMAWVVIGFNLLVLAVLFYCYLQGMTPLALAPFLFIALIISYFALTYKRNAAKKESAQLRGEFAEVFTYFSIYIQNDFPTYTALEKIRVYSSPKMREKIDGLLSDIDRDKTVLPYLRFSEDMDSMEIRQVMIAMYKMAEEGGSPSYIRQFLTLFAALSDNERRSQVVQKKDRLETMAMLPMIGSALGIALIIVAVMALLEGYSAYGF